MNCSGDFIYKDGKCEACGRTPEQHRDEETEEEGFYASVSWSPEDIKSIRPKWPEKRCAEFLQHTEDRLRDILIERGWEALETLAILWEKESKS